MDTSRYWKVSAVLLALFMLRVAGQLLQWLAPTELLPPFSAWQGSNLPYPLLLSIQVLIAAVMAWLTHAMRQERPWITRWNAKVVLWCGALYFAFMAFRLTAGLTVLSHVHWFASPISGTFHLVLAGYVLTLGAYLRARTRLAPAQQAGSLPGEAATR